MVELGLKQQTRRKELATLFYSMERWPSFLEVSRPWLSQLDLPKTRMV